MAPKHLQHRRVEIENARVPAPEHHVYANTMTVTAGGFDLALDFGNRVGEERPTPLVRVSMSYEHLSSMVRVLNGLVEQYSEEYGPVPDPESVIAERQNAAAESSGASS